MKTKLLTTILICLIVISCNKNNDENESNENNNTQYECPEDFYSSNYSNNLNLADSTIVYWGKTLKITKTKLFYNSESNVYNLTIEAPNIKLFLLFEPPTVKNCSVILQTESTLAYSDDLRYDDANRIAFSFWDYINYQSITDCKTSDSDDKYGYVKLTTYSNTFNLKFQDIQVRSSMFSEKPYQPVSMNLTLPYDCSVVCPK